MGRCVLRGWVLGGGGLDGYFGGVTDGKVLAFGGVEVQLPIFGPASAAV